MAEGESVKCPACGYENADDAVACGMCQSMFKAKKTSARLGSAAPVRVAPDARGKRLTLGTKVAIGLLLGNAITLGVLSVLASTKSKSLESDEVAFAVFAIFPAALDFGLALILRFRMSWLARAVVILRGLIGGLLTGLLFLVVGGPIPALLAVLFGGAVASLLLGDPGELRIALSFVAAVTGIAGTVYDMHGLVTGRFERRLESVSLEGTEPCDATVEGRAFPYHFSPSAGWWRVKRTGLDRGVDLLLIDPGPGATIRLEAALADTATIDTEKLVLEMIERSAARAKKWELQTRGPVVTPSGTVPSFRVLADRGADGEVVTGALYVGKGKLCRMFIMVPPKGWKSVAPELERIMASFQWDDGK